MHKKEEKYLSTKLIYRNGLLFDFHGERVLAFADYRLPLHEYPRGYPFDCDTINLHVNPYFEHFNFPTNGFRFLGLMSLIDPPRVNVAEAVRKCRSAGIR
jgi:sodium/potassium-transporting ATPase subunit alpha